MTGLAITVSYPNPNVIRFGMRGTLTGWAGIGFDPTGFAHGSMDTYVAWIMSSGSVILQDGYSNQFNIPTTDAVQSARVISGSQTGNQFRVSFERNLNTGDSNDFQFSSGQSVYVAWAYHLNANPGSTSIYTQYAQHTHMGSTQITINPPPPTSRVPSRLPVPTSSTPTPTPTPSSTPTPTPSSTLTPTPQLSLQGDENFHVSWQFIKDRIQFTYDCYTTGWVGIGFEPGKKIHRSTDTYISWITTSGAGVIQNGYSSSETQPSVDAIQSAQVLNASLIGNQFKLSFDRPIQASNPNDFDFSTEWVLMGWAYHSSTRPETTDLNSVIPIHTHRGSTYQNIQSGISRMHTNDSVMLSVYYLLSCVGLFLIYSLYRRVKEYQETVKPCNNQVSHWLFSKSLCFKVSRADILVCLGIVSLNAIPIGLGTAFGLTQSEIWGYMAAANSLVVAIPATRNSLIAWFSKIPFDQTIQYHRWIGRMIILQIFVHMLCSTQLYTPSMSNVYGIVALASVLFLGATSLESVRRQTFNLFYYSHFVFFIGYYVFGSLHSYWMFIYTCIATGLYGIDHMIRLCRGIYPRRTLMTQRLSSQIVKVRFPKPKTHQPKLGQYVFLNFPQVSWMEWHPFTLVSTPNDPFYEVYIKNLGDYTQELIYKLTQLESAWIRIDGPYGCWPFRYESFSHMIFVCGGVGITPCIAFIRNLYHQYLDIEQPRPSILQHVYLIWCCPKELDAEWVKDELTHAIDCSQKGSFTQFHLYVFITDQKTLKNPTYNLGRPDLDKVFNAVDKQMEQEEQFNGCVFTCGPKSLTQHTWQTWSAHPNGKRYEYHQEIFEF